MSANSRRLVKSFTPSSMHDGVLQRLPAVHFQRQIAAQDLHRRFADAQLPSARKFGSPSRKRMRSDSPRASSRRSTRGARARLEFLQAPVLQHLGVQEVLVDRGQLVVKHLVENSMTLASPFMPRSVVDAATLTPAWNGCRNANRPRCVVRRRGADFAAADQAAMRQDRQRRQRGRGLRLVEDLRGQSGATAATGARAGAHGQLGHAAATGRRDFADLAIGDAVADADVHGRTQDGGTRPFDHE